jgi:hypothetical protein
VRPVLCSAIQITQRQFNLLYTHSGMLIQPVFLTTGDKCLAAFEGRWSRRCAGGWFCIYRTKHLADGAGREVELGTVRKADQFNCALVKMKTEQILQIIGVLIIGLFVAVFCVFVKRAAKKEGYQFDCGRVILMLCGPIVFGGPLALLTWYLWPRETWLEKSVPLLSFIAFLFGPLLPIRLLGWKLPFPKSRR